MSDIQTNVNALTDALARIVELEQQIQEKDETYASLARSLHEIQHQLSHDANVISDIASTRAEEHDWCGVYDQIVDEINKRTKLITIKPRKTERTVRVQLDIKFSGRQDLMPGDDRIRLMLVDSAFDRWIEDYLGDEGDLTVETGSSRIEEWY